jgi:hypothetical protein
LSKEEEAEQKEEAVSSFMRDAGFLKAPPSSGQSGNRLLALNGVTISGGATATLRDPTSHAKIAVNSLTSPVVLRMPLPTPFNEAQRKAIATGSGKDDSSRRRVAEAALGNDPSPLLFYGCPGGGQGLRFLMASVPIPLDETALSPINASKVVALAPRAWWDYGEEDEDGRGPLKDPLLPKVDPRVHNGTKYTNGTHNTARSVDRSTVMCCVFWNLTEAAWSSKGCRSKAVESTPINGVASAPEAVCECDHMTSFSVMLGEALEDSVSITVAGLSQGETYLRALTHGLGLVILLSVAYSVYFVSSIFGLCWDYHWKKKMDLAKVSIAAFKWRRVMQRRSLKRHRSSLVPGSSTFVGLSGAAWKCDRCKAVNAKSAPVCLKCKATRPKAKAPACCPSGHVLQPYTTTQSDGAGTCDGCNSAIACGAKVMDCRRCNYYLCELCAAGGKAGTEGGSFNAAKAAGLAELADLAEGNGSREFDVVVPTGGMMGMGVKHTNGQTGCRVSTLIEGGKAVASGQIARDDWIIAINGKDVSRDIEKGVVEVLKAALSEGSDATLRFRRDGAQVAAQAAIETKEGAKGGERVEGVTIEMTALTATGGVGELEFDMECDTPMGKSAASPGGDAKGGTGGASTGNAFTAAEDAEIIKLSKAFPGSDAATGQQVSDNVRWGNIRDQLSARCPGSERGKGELRKRCEELAGDPEAEAERRNHLDNNPHHAHHSHHHHHQHHHQLHMTRTDSQRRQTAQDMQDELDFAKTDNLGERALVDIRFLESQLAPAGGVQPTRAKYALDSESRLSQGKLGHNPDDMSCLKAWWHWIQRSHDVVAMVTAQDSWYNRPRRALVVLYTILIKLFLSAVFMNISPNRSKALKCGTSEGMWWTCKFVHLCFVMGCSLIFTWPLKCAFRGDARRRWLLYTVSYRDVILKSLKSVGQNPQARLSMVSDAILKTMRESRKQLDLKLGATRAVSGEDDEDDEMRGASMDAFGAPKSSCLCDALVACCQKKSRTPKGSTGTPKGSKKGKTKKKKEKKTFWTLKSQPAWKVRVKTTILWTYTWGMCIFSTWYLIGFIGTRGCSITDTLSGACDNTRAGEQTEKEVNEVLGAAISSICMWIFVTTPGKIMIQKVYVSCVAGSVMCCVELFICGRRRCKDPFVSTLVDHTLTALRTRQPCTMSPLTFFLRIWAKFRKCRKSRHEQRVFDDDYTGPGSSDRGADPRYRGYASAAADAMSNL